ncbi:MAG TPA: hypothetical protein DEF61_01665 [Firmicutes bacterium]|nr:hypothetical protein [Bacillota bacterium]HBM69988.1 hypothetical protein [Bacillota bacterium]HBX24983.1 hypothetical protein [Bacillota bacterium]
MENKISKLRPLVGHINREMDRRFELNYLYLLPLDLGAPQGMALNYICRHPGCSSCSLIDRFMLKKSTISEILNYLCEKEYVTTIADEKDKRIKCLYPTETGLDFYKKSKRVFAMFENELESYLTKEEKDEFIRLGEKLSSKLEEVNRNGK